MTKPGRVTDPSERHVSTEPAFIRCIKSNHKKEPGIFSQPLALQQLKNGGLFEAIRIRRAGYSYRVPHEQFAKSFAIIYPEAFAMSREVNADQRAVCGTIMSRFTEQFPDKMDNANWQVGKSKVFLKTSMEQNALEGYKHQALMRYRIRIQAIARGYLVRWRIYMEKHAERLEEERKEKEREKERQKLREEEERLEAIAQAEAEMQINSAVALQTVIRKFVAVRQYRKLSSLIPLSHAQKVGNIEDLQNALTVVKESASEDMKEYPGWARKKIEDADRQLRRLIEVNNVLQTIEESKRNLNLDVLKQSLERVGTCAFVRSCACALF